AASGSNPPPSAAITQDALKPGRTSKPPETEPGVSTNPSITGSGSFGSSSSKTSDPLLQQAGSVSGAWGATASGLKRRRIPAAAILLACGAMLVAVAIAIAVVTSKPPSGKPLDANSAVAVESTVPPVPSSAMTQAADEPPAAATASAAPSVSTPSANTAKTRSTGRTKTTPPSGTGTGQDPFGMDRK
ncbi:MAG TPA: hypothetical protein PK156_16440, partial [Polyangium sp.]|nr:hypothetical protein [Polyangium sp.]